MSVEQEDIGALAEAMAPPPPPDAAQSAALLGGWLGDPFALLGPRYETLSEHSVGLRLCCYHPGASAVQVFSRPAADADAHGALLGNLIPSTTAAGIFYGNFLLPVTGVRPQIPYVLHVAWPQADGSEIVQITEDAYAFGLLLGDLDLHLLREGRHRQLGRCLGAQHVEIDGVAGVRFAVWAPNARRVSVVGDFNQWDGRRHGMRLRQDAGVWELFIPRLVAGSRYKYEIIGADGTLQPLKADPVARATERPPATASLVPAPEMHVWRDDDWMAQRPARQSLQAPLSIYEVHVESWLRIPEQDARNLNWDELAERLIPYACEMGFTHLELLPIMEYPFGGSWGYQPLGQFAPSARFGPVSGFSRFVERCHAAQLGVILDWVPAHFPSDAHGLAHFDGTPLYEHSDPREGFHQDWNTLIFNLGRHEVRGFLIASALEWLEHYHVDGLRVDAVASMLYRDYSRKPGEWVPNIHGGRENLEAVAFLRELNETVEQRCPGVLMIAEESTAWPGVTAPVAEQGLGFTYKWNMGWMHDSLRYVANDPLFRRYHHHDFTFGLIYAFSERFVLPVSHDEVVHGKRSLLQKMPGDRWQQLANLRAYFGFMWTHPGKKLLFMGCEFGQDKEFDHDQSPQWELLDDPQHRNVQRLVRDLNRLYRGEPALHRWDTRAEGFSWVVGDDSVNSVFAFFRHDDSGGAPLLVVINMTPQARTGYRIGVPDAGHGAGGTWHEILNTDAAVYGGSNGGNHGAVSAEGLPWHGHPASLTLHLPPLSTLILRRGNN